jgi:hypothetical protein
MATYGMEVFDPAGSLIFDTRKKGMVLIDIFSVAFDSGAVKTYPSYTGRTIVAVAVENTGGNNSIAFNHTVAVSGTTVTVTNTTLTAAHLQMVGASAGSPSNVYVFVR